MIRRLMNFVVDHWPYLLFGIVVVLCAVQVACVVALVYMGTK